MEAYRRLSRIRRIAFWVAVLTYCTTLPLLVLDIFGLSVRLLGPRPFLATGALTLSTRPEGSDVRVDGRRAGRTPLSLERVTPGDHRVEIRRAGAAAWRGTVSIRPGRVTSVQGLPLAAEPVRVHRVGTGPAPAVLHGPAGPFFLVLEADQPPAVLDLRRGLSRAVLAPVPAFPGAAVDAHVVGSGASFLVETGGAGGPGSVLVYRPLIGEWSAMPLPFTAPQDAPLLDASSLDRSVTYLTAEAARLRTPQGDRLLHAFREPAIAWGIAEARALVLDRGGMLYRLGGLLPVLESAAGPPPVFPGTGWGRIITARGGAVAWLADGWLFVGDAKRCRAVGPAGGAVDDPRRQRILLWHDRAVGQLELRPAVDADAPAPRVEWLLRTADPVCEVLPVRGGDGCLVRTERELLLACLASGVVLDPVAITAVESGASPPLLDAAGYAVFPTAGGLRVFDVQAVRGAEEAAQ